jgi:VanZ family protein
VQEVVSSNLTSPTIFPFVSGCAGEGGKMSSSLMENDQPAQRLRWIYPLALAATIFFASGQGSLPAPDIVNIDKVTHFAVFGLLATLVCRCGFPPPRAWLAVVITSIYGMTDEWHQSFVPGRSVDIADWVADTLGAMLAVALYARWSWYRDWLEAPVIRKSRIENPPVAVTDSGT